MNNWASNGSFSQVNINGRWVDSNSPEALQQQKANMLADQEALTKTIKGQEGLVEAQANDAANAMEMEDNKAAAKEAFNFATSIANRRRPVGGGVQRGGMNTLNSVTGGLAAANAKARRESMLKLGKAKLDADPMMVARRSALQNIQAMTKVPKIG